MKVLQLYFPSRNENIFHSLRIYVAIVVRHNAAAPAYFPNEMRKNSHKNTPDVCKCEEKQENKQRHISARVQISLRIMKPHSRTHLDVAFKDGKLNIWYGDIHILLASDCNPQ